MDEYYTQSWQYSRKYPKGKPIFYKNGKRISFEEGLKLIRKGVFGNHLNSWLNNNGFEEYSYASN